MDIIQKAFLRRALSVEEIEAVLSTDRYDEALFKAADLTRQRYVKRDVHLKGLLEFSNVCLRTCHYCGLRRENDGLKRYSLSPDEIVGLAKKAATYGYRTIVLQSGENREYSVGDFCKVIENIRALNLSVTLSIGEKSENEYRAYKEAGANRYLLRIETTDKPLYKALHPSMSYERRVKCLKILKKLGYETGSGSLVGLPHQTAASIAEDILFFQENDFDMIGIGPFIPCENTPLSAAQGGSFDMALKVMALVRVLMPTINIPATTAMETLRPNGRILALQNGANVVMPVITEGEYRALYRLYPGKVCVGDTPSHCRGCISGKIRSINRDISVTNGDSERFIIRKEIRRAV
ncbi:MAG: [FeFe] hydrogenase H-cluster radical SAM maturase HydE [Campylobacteraceae bacterium]|jgi:biotin synthase|nr:[FeFe] hydrogenase H-cluster radical SAM maturase HydE [Campylobacteraceae bacterium]